MLLSKYTRMKTLAAIAAGTLAFGCGGGSDPMGNGGTTDGTNGDQTNGTGSANGGTTAPAGGVTLPVTFSPMYSAYDGEHPFKLPVHVGNYEGDLTVTTEPPDFVDADPTEYGVMLTMRKAGDAVVTFTDEAGNVGSAQLHVREAGPNEFELGSKRYNNGLEAFNIPDGGFNFDDDGGMPPMMGDGDDFLNPESACAFCHLPDGASADPEADSDRIDIEHTPMQTGGYSDEEIIAIFTEGQKPEGSEFHVLPDFIGPTVYPMFHRWDVEEDVKVAIVTYLRGLEPKEQGEIDFGGLIPDRPPGGGGNNNTGSTGDSTGDTGDTTGDAGADTGDAGADTGDAGTDTGDAGTDTGDAGEETTE